MIIIYYIESYTPASELFKIVPIPFVIFTLVSLSLIRVNSRKSDSGSQSRLFSPLPTTVRALQFYSAKTSVVSFFVGSSRIVPKPSLGGLTSYLISHFCYIFQEIHSLNPNHREVRVIEGN